MKHKALFYKTSKELNSNLKIDSDSIQCFLCVHNCIIKNNKRGICGVRENENGELYSLVYSMAVSSAVDPIEKKPLFNFHPGTKSLSIATVGCNLHCTFCQNHSISQMPRDNNGLIQGNKLLPEQVVQAAKIHGCRTISYTYTEPTIYYEYAKDCMELAICNEVKNIWVTNGYISEEPLKKLDGLLHAANVDLKSYSESFYKKHCKASLEPVKQTIIAMKQMGVWVEITTLLIPGENDDQKELTKLAEFIASVDPSIPWHVSRFHPTYNMLNKDVTSVASIKKALKCGKDAGLRYIYAGNVWGEKSESTFCYSCNNEIISRYGFSIEHNRLQQNTCPDCGTQIDIITD